jgi:phage repressor protein C with HTH and peptisase S24 domain/transcriptional regulator with XRE-family HTH domain
VIEALGPKIRRQRRRLGLTLDELAGKTSISKPYLSLIETGRVPNPPSDEKLRRLEQTLGFTPNELLTQAHLQRTPRDVRAMLEKLVRGAAAEDAGTRGRGDAERGGGRDTGTRGRGDAEKNVETTRAGALSLPVFPRPRVPVSSSSALPTNLDEAYLSGVLQELVDRSAGNVESITANAIPVINRVSAGYPKDFTDLSYPRGVADDYVSSPDLHDRNAFAARVHGDSMTPKYRQGDIVIFSPALAPREGDDCFVRFQDGQTTFKRVFFESGEKGASVIRLQPRNEKYRPQVVPSENITGLYRAVYRYQRVDEDR